MKIIKFRTKPSVKESVFLATNSLIIGDVTIDEDSSIWFGSVLRGDMNFIKIGKKTNVQDNCTIHVTNDTSPTIIGEKVTIGHNAVVHGCKIENKCLIGINSTILDDSTIGEGSIIGAGTVIPPNTEIPKRSLVIGVPGKIVRKTTDEEYKMIIERSKHYVEFSKNYKNILDE
jgi:carbonic anhydrase/acetyltransferase-like protein (isoleucine patch superfamily)